MTTCTAQTKFCPVCQTTLPADSFFKHGGHKDGLQTRCRTCANERSRNRRLSLDTPKSSRATKLAPAPKKLPSVILEAPPPIADIPGIYEIEHRGRGTRSFRFDSPIDGSVFSFKSFADARKGRQSMMDAFKQQAAYDSTHRLSTAARWATAAGEDDFE